MRVVRPSRCVAACAVCLLILWPASSVLAAAHSHIDRSGKPQSGVASYYGAHAAGKKTASGKTLAPNKMTAASRTLPLGTKAKVTNAETGKSVGVTVTDRGPYARHRILDVSPKAAQDLGMKDDGVAKVKVQPLHEPPPSEAAGSDKKR